MKTNAFLFSACVSGLALVAFACSSTTTDTPSAHDAGTNTGKTPSGKGDSGTTTPEEKDSGPTPDGSACDARCAQQAKAGCPNDGTIDECVANCTSTRDNLPAECGSDYDAFIACGATATFTCDEDEGKPSSSDCQDEALALLKCVKGTTDGGAPDDGGTDGGTGQTCADAAYVGTVTDISKKYAWKAPTPQKGACTTAEVSTIQKNANTAKAPSDFIAGSVSKKCGACALTSSTDKSWGPIVAFPDNSTLFNYGACAATVSNNATCGKMYEYLRICFREACHSCSDSTSFSECASAAMNGPQCNQVLKAVDKNCTDLNAIDKACSGLSKTLTVECVNGQ